MIETYPMRLKAPRSLVYGFVIFFLLALFFPLFANTVNVLWDANPQNSLSGVIGYTIFYGTESGVYTNSVDVGNVRKVSIEIDAKTYFVVAAFNGCCHGPKSDEVYYDPALLIDEETPTIPLAVYPNPFQRTVSFTGYGTITIYNEGGQLVASSVNEFWDSGEFASGIYFCVSKAGNFKTFKIIKMR